MPLLQMHDCLDCSVTSREQGELVARLGCEAVTLAVPMRVDLKFGRNWGDATHSWDELPAAPINVTKSHSEAPAAKSPSAPSIVPSAALNGTKVRTKKPAVKPAKPPAAKRAIVRPAAPPLR